MGIVTQFISLNLLKILMFLALLYIGHQWSAGALDKQIAKIKKFKKRYGVLTVVLILVWWILTPSGLPDDFITLYLIETYGLFYYVIFTVGLTIYLVYRLGITISVYTK